ncbi:transcription termination factor 1, mitochondrial [Cheilinus undulatus]|uniref:transcription termination factor 1, mitochondrial n=1 Tax=Cheilinus undulatus TaxID=241271 RepID=UPI001BD465B5|nr:transcription termination factor 1, mitochondrial [Cheilinus undulatus]
MAALPGMKTLFSLHRSLTLQRFALIPAQSTSSHPHRRLCSSSTGNADPEPQVTENESLLENLNLMGVDVREARRRQPGVFRRAFTNEQEVAQFLQGKGASREVVAGIISRYPRAITRSGEHMEQRWGLWRNIFKTDVEIVNILDRSPESFFRSSDNKNLEKNIAFLSSLGLESKDLHRLLAAAPRTFSNSFELNRQMVEVLEDICSELGGTNPQQFAKNIISRNAYILTRSTKRVKTNIDILRASLKLSGEELLALFKGPGAEILDLSNEYLKNNLNSLQQKMVSLGCKKADLKKLVYSYPLVLYIGRNTLISKLDCLLKGGIKMTQILEKPKVLDYSTENITGRLEELKKVGYDFEKNGINILDTSKKRFDAKLEKLKISR